jgi:hypothetical protein
MTAASQIRAVATQIHTQRRVVATADVRHSAKFVHRDEGGRLDRVDEINWVAVDGLVPASVVTGMVEEAVRSAAPQIERAVSEALKARDDAPIRIALPAALDGELAIDYNVRLEAQLDRGLQLIDGEWISEPQKEGN